MNDLHLVVLIPAFNEEEHLPSVLADLPRELPEFARISVLVVDDGSTDGTAEVARSLGATVARHRGNRGLAAAFRTGVDRALRLGADVIVVTDADHQYRGVDIPRLVAPILNGAADLVVGVRDAESMRHFSRTKRFAQRLGSRIVRLASNTDVPDAPSGFRAMTVATARRLEVHNDYTYTLETLIQAGRSGLRIDTVPITVNPPRRPSRLFTSWPRYVLRSTFIIARIAALYRPFRFFAGLSAVVAGVGTVLLIRVALADNGEYLATLVFGSALLAIALQLLIAGFVADAIAANRRTLSDLRLGLIAGTGPRPVGRGEILGDRPAS